MDIFILYCIFSVATSLTSMYELVWPVMSKQEEEVGPIESKYIMYVTFFLLNTLIAPVILFSCLIPSWGLRFRFTLQDVLFKDKN
jgi:hypothetical protein